MDIKIHGLTRPIIEEAIAATKKARTYIMDEVMSKAIAEPRKEVGEFAPKIIQMQIDPPVSYTHLILNKKAVVSVIRLKEMEFFQAKPSDLDGIVSVLRQTRGVEVAILLYELEPQTFKVSLRSKEIVDVSAVAKYYGGGGHVRAAGVTMKGSPYDVINNLTLLIERQLRAAEEKNEEK